MARFRYSLQSILDIKEKLETQEKQAFAAAQVRVSTEEEKLNQLELGLAAIEEETRQSLMGDLNVFDIQINKAKYLAQTNYIADQKLEVSRAESRLEQERIKLAEIRTERKTYETLREQAFEEFLQEENKAEGRVVDELVSYTFGQKRQEK